MRANRLRKTVKTCGSGGDGGDDRDCEGQRLSSFSLTLLPIGSFMTRWIDQSDRSVWALVKTIGQKRPHRYDAELKRRLCSLPFDKTQTDQSEIR